MELLIALFSLFVLAPAAPLLHRWVGDRVGYLIAVLPAGLVVFFAQYVGRLEAGEAVTVVQPWVPGLGLSLSLYLDGLSLFFALLITAIGALVSIYTSGYLAGHRRIGVFFAYILLFMGSMLGLVLAGNLLTLYVFWELTSLSSFLLIGFEDEREAARSAAVQALLVTVLGGLALLAGFVMLGLAGGSFELRELLARGEVVRDHAWYPAILLLVLIGAFTKSAQFPFHFWLPNAMEAPTPVSAYLHSATMVKAGVYLLARMTPVLGETDLWLGIVTTVGAVTMLLGAVLAVYEHDMKGILAYLTISVLGTLTMLLGLGTELALKAAMTYLMAHAFYKGALFLMTGAVDHQTHARDVRALGGLAGKMPLTAVVAVLAALSMAGIIPLFGFVAKETLLEAVLHSPYAPEWLTVASVVTSVLLVTGAGLIGVRPFFGKRTPAAERAREAGFSLWASPVVLALAGIAVGLFPQELATPLVQPAAAAIAGRPFDVELKLWHGLTTPFLLSAIAVVVGFVLYLGRRALLQLDPLVQLAGRWGPAAGYRRTLAGLNRLAESLTHLLQAGFLRTYIVIILATTVGLLGLMLVNLEDPFTAPAWPDIRFHEIVPAVLIVVAALVTVRATTQLRAVAGLGIVGFNVAWIFSLFGAPDLAMTQIVVEALTVVLFVLAFYHLPQFSILSDRRTRVRDAALAIGAGSVLTGLLYLVTGLQRGRPVSDFLAQQSVPAAHGRNVVNVILVDFRALDTLGEISVLATAGAGVFALLRLYLNPVATGPSGGAATRDEARSDRMDLHPAGPAQAPGRPGSNVSASLILRTATRYLLPLLVLFSLFLLLRGHDEPGGGFVGGLIAAAALGLCAIAFDAETARRVLHVEPRLLIGLGLSLAAASGLAGLLIGRPFLYGRWGTFDFPGVGRVDVGTPLLFDLGVYLVVVGVTLLILFSLKEEEE